jgi:DNA-binding transcriptional LysR family regulator
VFTDLDEVQRVSASLRGGKAVAELRIASILTLGHEVIPRALKIFSAKHPDVSVVIKTFHSPEMLSALLLHEADVGFLYGPASHPALQLEEVGQARIVCVAPKGVLPARALKKGAITLQELAGTRVIGVESTQTLGATISQACREAGIAFSTPFTVQTYHAALALVRHGLGAALVDSCTALSADLDDVEIVELEPAMPVAILAARPAAAPASVTVRKFVKAVQQVLARP